MKKSFTSVNLFTFFVLCLSLEISQANSSHPAVTQTNPSATISATQSNTAEQTAIEDWELAVDKDGIRIFTQHVPNSQLKAFQAHMVLESTDISTVESLLKNYDQIPNWLDRCKESRVLEKIDSSRAILYVALGMPWPVKDRDIVGLSHISLSDDGKTLHSVTELIASPEQDVVMKGRIRADKLRSKITVTQINEKDLKLVMQGHAEPGGRVPSWLANLMVTESPFNSLDNIRKLVNQ